MGRSDTKRESPLNEKGTSSSGKSKETPSNAGGGTSRTSTKDKRIHLSVTGPAFIDVASVPTLGPKLVSPPLDVYDHQELSLRPSTGLDSLGIGKLGPHSVSSAGSTAEQANTHKVFSVISGNSTNMSEAAETKSLDQGPREEPAADLHIHANEEFLPGKIVKLECFDEAPLVWDGEGPRPSHAQFLARNSARRRKMGLFAIFRTHLDYSMAIRIHTYDADDQALNQHPEHQAIIYTDSHKPHLTAGGNTLPNPAIQVKRDGPEELPQGSRLDYSDIFIIEHNVRVAFIGQVTRTCFPQFAKTYQNVQRLLGRDVLRPQSRAKSAVPASTFDASSSSHAQLPRLKPVDLVARPFGGPSSPETCTGDMTSSSSAGRTPAEQIAVRDAGWLGGFTSEVPIDQLRPSGGTKAETINQDKYSPRFAGYRTGGDKGMGALDSGRAMPQMIECYSNEQKERIELSGQWIADATKRQEQMMRLVLQPHQSVQEFLNSYDKKGGAFAASRVRVAILDTEVDTNSAVFTPYIKCIKEYRDFRPNMDKSTPQLNSHGTHVTSLFLQMAPEAEVYVAKAFDTWESLAQAIQYAIESWNVDIISISGGGRVEHHEDLDAALSYAHFMRVHVFAATHNNGLNEDISAPARVETVYPVFSTDSHGNLSLSAADPIGPHSFGTLGENIETFWMEPVTAKDPSSKHWSLIHGSSFSTPIVTGILASTLLCIRLALQASCTPRMLPPTLVKTAILIHSAKFTTAIMEILSVPSRCGKCRYVRPFRLLSLPLDETLVDEIPKMVRSVAAGTWRTPGARS